MLIHIVEEEIIEISLSFQFIKIIFIIYASLNKLK